MGVTIPVSSLCSSSMEAKDEIGVECERWGRRPDSVEVRAFCAAIGVGFTAFSEEFDRKVAGPDR